MIQSTVSEMEKEFVKNISSETRKEIFENYLKYLAALNAAFENIPFIQWINGSFTTKRTDPSDIDLVSFIDYSILYNSRELFEQFVYPNSYRNYDVDAYIVPVYPEDHKSYSLYISDRLDWLDNFNKTWFNRAGKRFPKGFLELKINC